MANTLEHDEHDEHDERDEPTPKQPQSRRRFITWAGEIVAGVSLAGIGIGLLNPKAALAEPECYPCPTCCTFISCQKYGGCQADTPYRATYHVQYGCVGIGQQCPYTVYEACQMTCTPDDGQCGGQC